jgi:hypothetical protein
MEASMEMRSDDAQTPWTATLGVDSAPVAAGFLATTIAVAMANAALRALLKVIRKGALLTRRPRVIGPEDATEILHMTGALGPRTR